jgi:hypothetical protein
MSVAALGLLGGLLLVWSGRSGWGARTCCWSPPVPWWPAGSGEAFQLAFSGTGFVVVQASEGRVVPRHSH